MGKCGNALARCSEAKRPRRELPSAERISLASTLALASTSLGGVEEEAADEAGGEAYEGWVRQVTSAE